MAPSRINVGTADVPLLVSPVALGCWPIAGVTSLGTTRESSLATIQAALDCGINFFDTAHCYGFNGEADALLHESLSQRDDVVVASKVGMHYAADRSRVVDGRPETLKRHAKEVLSRLGRKRLDILYLHLPDPAVPIEESAGAIKELVEDGIALHAGVSNVTSQQLHRFSDICRPAIVQNPFNMLQRSEQTDVMQQAESENMATAAYWVLMKGLLAGKMPRNHNFDPSDRRLAYDVFKGSAWQRAQDLLDELRALSQELSCTVSQLVVAWTLQQPFVSTCLCGAKRPHQILETAAAMELELSSADIHRVEEIVANSG